MVHVFGVLLDKILRKLRGNRSSDDLEVSTDPPSFQFTVHSQIHALLGERIRATTFVGGVAFASDVDLLTGCSVIIQVAISSSCSLLASLVFIITTHNTLPLNLVQRRQASPPKARFLIQISEAIIA